MTASAIVLLPEPDSPTTARVRPLPSASETSLSAVTAPPGMR